jgi:hypothetical protein
MMENNKKTIVKISHVRRWENKKKNSKTLHGSPLGMLLSRCRKIFCVNFLSHHMTKKG